MVKNLIAFACAYLLIHGVGGVARQISGSVLVGVIAAAVCIGIIGFGADRAFGGNIPRTARAACVVGGMVVGLLLLSFSK